MKRLPHISAITLMMLCMVERPAAGTTPDAVAPALTEALKNCRPTAEEIQKNEADRENLPEYMRELTEVDYRLAKCEQSARLCRASPESPECRAFLAEMTRSGESSRR
jgi:hypothetical protein